MYKYRLNICYNNLKEEKKYICYMYKKLFLKMIK